VEPVIKGFYRHGHVGDTIKVREYIAVGNQSHRTAEGLAQGCGQSVKGWTRPGFSTEDRHTPRTHRTEEREDLVEIKALDPFEVYFSVNLLPVAAEAAEIAANEIERTGAGLRIVGDAVNIHDRTSIAWISAFAITLIVSMFTPKKNHKRKGLRTLRPSWLISI
jgi:uncharacterized membrane protein